MGRLNSREEQAQTLEWAQSFKAARANQYLFRSIKEIAQAFYNDLRRYFSLSVLSRHTKAAPEHVALAYDLVFPVRVRLESSIKQALLATVCANPEATLVILLSDSIFGASKKQGVSLRMPLTTCVPTRLCAAACYAHDVLDAAPLSVTRGCINGVIAELFQHGDKALKKRLLILLKPSVRDGIRRAEAEVPRSSLGWKREPFIRFAHIGEMAAYPRFANALAGMVRELSGGLVRCVVYTRHPDADKFDPALWIVNFTLDESSEDRVKWAPKGSRVVYSAFGGRLSSTAMVNFLEHHRWQHMEPIGVGTVCPATHPDTKVRTCDAVGCDLCMCKHVMS